MVGMTENGCVRHDRFPDLENIYPADGWSQMHQGSMHIYATLYDDIIKWKHFPRYWPFVRGIHPSQRPVTRSFDVFFDLRLE